MDDVEYRLLSASTHVARKQHRCRECGGIIMPGQVYDREFFLADGDPVMFKRHKDGGICAGQAIALEDAQQIINEATRC